MPRPSRPYRSQFNHAVLRLTAAAPTSPPSTAPELFLLRHPSPPRICFPSADIRPRQHSQQFVHGFVQACTLQNITFPGKKKKIGATCGGDHTGNQKWYSSSLIHANLTCLLAWYSSHRRHKLTASSYTFFLILDIPSNSRCTRFLLIYYFTLARGPSPP